MTTIKLAKRIGTDISSRRTASIFRAELVSMIASGGGPIELDFADVESVSDSFLDELVAVTVKQFGTQWFREHIRVTNLTADDRASLLQIINRRLHEAESVLVCRESCDSYSPPA
jgi:hypothetical protein